MAFLSDKFNRQSDKPVGARKCTHWLTDPDFFVIQEERLERPESFIRDFDGSDETVKDMSRTDPCEDTFNRNAEYEELDNDHNMDWAR